MMKFLGMMLAVLAAAAMAEGESQSGSAATTASKIDVANVVGVTIVESSDEYLPLAVPYGMVGVEANRPINVTAYATNLVFTANLVAGDMLYVYNHAEKQYHAYELHEDQSSREKTWGEVNIYDATSGSSVSGSPTAHAAQTLNPDLKQPWGYGFWLQRIGVTNRTDRKVYLAGQVPVGNVTVTVPGNVKNSSEKGKSLLGNPFNQPWNINSYNWSGKAMKWDTIQLRGGASTVYQYNGSAWKKKTGSGTGTVIPAATAFWYQRGSTNATGSVSFEFTGILFEAQTAADESTETK